MSVASSLLAPILYGSRDALADCLCGALLRVANMPREQLAVVRALLSHRGFHSNRIWASLALLAEESGTSQATAKRAMARLKKFGVRILRGDELAAGPGPHLCPEEKRLGEFPVNCYDLSPLVALLPDELVGLFNELLAGVQDTRQQEQLAVLSVDPQDPSTWPNPFDDVAEPAASEEVLLSASSTTSASPSQSPSLFRATSTAPMSDVDGRTVSSGARPRQKSAAPRPAERVFPGVKIDPYKERTTRKPEKAVLDEVSEKAVEALVKVVGIAPRVAKKMVAERGAAWCGELLVYGRECGVRDGEAKGAGWHVQVARLWENEGWPDWLKPILRRETDTARRRGAAREVLAVEDIAARKIVTAVALPDRPATPPDIGVDMALAALDDTARAELIDRVVADVCRGRSAPAQRIIRNQREKNSDVLARLQNALGAT